MCSKGLNSSPSSLVSCQCIFNNYFPFGIQNKENVILLNSDHAQSRRKNNPVIKLLLLHVYTFKVLSLKEGLALKNTQKEKGEALLAIYRG